MDNPVTNDYNNFKLRKGYEIEDTISRLKEERNSLINSKLSVEPKETVAVEPDELNYILDWDGCYVIDVQTKDNLNNIAHRYYFLSIDNNKSEDTTTSVITYNDLSETEGKIEVTIQDVSGIGSVKYK